MNRRRILIIGIAAGVLVLVALGAYLLLRSRNGAGDTTGTLPEIGGDFANLSPTASELASSTVPLDPVSAYHAFPDGTVIAVHRDGKVSRVSGTTIAALSSAPIDNFAAASFSADGNKILVLTGQQPRSQVNLFDVATASWRTVPGTFRDAVWGPRGVQLATLTPDAKTGKTAVGIYDTSAGRTVQTLATLALGDVSIAWPAPNTIIVADKPNAFSNGSAWAIDVASKRITLAARGKEGFTAIWDGSATRGLALEAELPGRGGILSLLNNTVAVAKLAFVTLPQKCTFTRLAGAGSSTTPYFVCAVPRDQDALQLRELPDSWLRREFFTDDILIGVNLDTQNVDFSIVPPLPMDATRLQVVSTTIYYADRASDRLYKSEI